MQKIITKTLSGLNLQQTECFIMDESLLNTKLMFFLAGRPGMIPLFECHDKRCCHELGRGHGPFRPFFPTIENFSKNALKFNV